MGGTSENLTWFWIVMYAAVAFITSYGHFKENHIVCLMEVIHYA